MMRSVMCLASIAYCAMPSAVSAIDIELEDNITRIARERCSSELIKGKDYSMKIDANGDVRVSFLGKKGAGLNGVFLYTREEWEGKERVKLEDQIEKDKAYLKCVQDERKDLSKRYVPDKSSTMNKAINIKGSWGGSPDCTVVFYKDNGNEIEGSCDNAGYKHKIRGTYDGSPNNNIRVTITRIDPKGCATNAQGNITIINKNSISFSQEGWRGCGIATGSATQSWSRL
ncbi:MAG: hypothetical protein AB2551_12575 [Candidatus Thiodiazotropha sp.]